MSSINSIKIDSLIAFEPDRKALEGEKKEVQSVTLPEALLPPRMITSLLAGDNVNYVQNKGYMSARNGLERLTRFVLKVGAEALKAIKGSNYTAFDALVGDFACQSRAYILFDIFSSKDLVAEVETIGKLMSEYLAKLASLKNEKTNTKELIEFFKTVNSIKVSKKMEYLFQTYVLTLTKQLKEDGITEVSNFTKLDSLASKSQTIDNELRKEIVKCLQARVSESSIALIALEAAKLTGKGADLTKRMLASEMTRQFTPEENYPKKSFSFLFYNLKAICSRLKENQTVLVFKDMNKTNEAAIVACFRSAKPGEAFEHISVEEARKIVGEKSPVVVFEGSVRSGINPSALIQFFAKEGVEEVVLSNAAQEPQFDSQFTLNQLKDEQALAELAQYQVKAEKMDCVKGKNPLFLLDHVFASSLQIELAAKKGGKK